MNRPVKLALLFAAAVMVGHVGLVLATPHVLMNVAMKRVSGDGRAINMFTFGQRTTQNSRNIVRPSPDLAYSTCVYDLSKGPIRVKAAPSPDQGYVSISVFAANSDNVAVFDSSQMPQGINFVLARQGQAAVPGERMVYSASAKGIILDRRLAPNAELFAKADQARRADSCAPVSQAR